MADDDKAREAGQQQQQPPPAQRIERKPVGSGSNSTPATSGPAAAAAAGPASGDDSAPDDPPPSYEASNAGQNVTGDQKGPVPGPEQGSSNGGPGSGDAARTSTSQRQRTPPSSIQIDKTQPEDFEGELATTNELPSPEMIKQIDDYIVLDKDGRSHTFKTLYSGTNVARRVLIIFVRHFFCGV